MVWLLLLFGLLGLSYSLVIPVFEAPDEAWHYAYVRHVAEGRGLPALSGDDSGANQEVAQPPLYYAVAALFSATAPDDDLAGLMWHNPGFGYQAGGTTNDNKNMLVHTARERFPWRGAVLAVRLARLASLAFGALAVLATRGLGREAFPNRPARALGAAAVVALIPQFLFVSGVINNDSAAAALSTAALWALARAANRGPTLRRSLGLGVLLGLAALTKTSVLLLWPLAALVLALALRKQATRPRTALGHLALIFVTAAIVGGWWYLRNALQYGDPFGFQVHGDTPWGRPTPATLATILSELPRLYRSFWGAFGWGHVQFPSWMYLALGGLVAASLAGWCRALLRRRSPGRAHVFLLASAWCLLVLAALLQWMRQVEAPHGRLLFPAIGAWAVLMVGGWNALPWRRLPALLLASLLVLALLTPWATIRPAFATPRLVSPERAAGTVEPAGLIFGDSARLLGVALERSSAAPGEELAVRACWEALAPMTRDYTVFVHLVGWRNVRVAERYTYPGLGRFPTSLWPVGEAFCDSYRLRVEAWAPVPELYDVMMGLTDASSGERLLTRNSEGDTVGFPAVAQVRIAPQEPLAASPQHPLHYRLGEQISLLGYTVSRTPQSGTPVTVTLTWRAEAAPQGDYVAFVHLLDASGQQLAQDDSPPRHGRYPTAAWQAGDVVPDEHVLEIPPLAPNEPAHWGVGMYRSHTLERLPVLGPEGPVKDNLILLPVEP